MSVHRLRFSSFSTRGCDFKKRHVRDCVTVTIHVVNFSSVSECKRFQPCTVFGETWLLWNYAFIKQLFCHSISHLNLRLFGHLPQCNTDSGFNFNAIKIGLKTDWNLSKPVVDQSFKPNLVIICVRLSYSCHCNPSLYILLFAENFSHLLYEHMYVWTGLP